MKILLANPRGFCAGVKRAIAIVERSLEIYGPPIYVRHEIVHNKYVVENLKKRGVIFVENIKEVPEDSVLIFSAHGVSWQVRQEALSKNIKILLDATCPLVTKVHVQVSRASRMNQEMILIGHKGHPEVEGTMGQYKNSQKGIYLVKDIKDADNIQVKDPDNLGYVTQTTLSLEETKEIIAKLQKRFPNIKPPRKQDICYATTNRQKAVYDLSKLADCVIVVGSSNSSNSNRLKEVAIKAGKPAYLVDCEDDLFKSWFENTPTVGITAGASAPESLVTKIVDRLKEWGADDPIEMPGIEENVVFEIPKAIKA